MKTPTIALLVTLTVLATNLLGLAQQRGPGGSDPDRRGDRDRERRGGVPPWFRDGPAEPMAPEDLEFEMGAAAIADREMFEKLSYQGPDAGRDSYLAGIEFVKFIIDGAWEAKPAVYFMNTKNHRGHPPFMGMIGLGRGRDGARGALCYLPRVRAPDGEAGLYIFDFQPHDSYGFEDIRSFHDILVEKAPVLKGKLAFHPLGGNLERYEKERDQYLAAGLPVYLDDDKFAKISFLPLNPGESFGRLRVMTDGMRPSPRDIVICQTLPNQMPRVAGVISVERQTPLSHVNLRAIQDKVPNAYVENALEKEAVRALLGKDVLYRVTSQGYVLRTATPEEVETHFRELRPVKPQSPARDLDVQEIRSLDAIGFEDSTRFGVKAANLAAMRRFGFPEGVVPAGHAIPFTFYDAFMKHNGFDDRAKRLIETWSQIADRERFQSELEKFQEAIEKGDLPANLRQALTDLQKSFPADVSIRCRSSTNNEDLPGFSGAGLYDSYTHKPDEGHLVKTIRQVYASLWNFRAFEEREFHRIDHLQVAMGVLVHPNFKGEKANGVAVTEDILYESQGFYYINTQVGEDLVTNPEVDSSPEEILLGWYERDGHEVVRRSAHAPNEGGPILSEEHLKELRKVLGVIHLRFAGLYKRDPDDLKFAMEIEFKIDRENGLVIKQARQWVF